MTTTYPYHAYTIDALTFTPNVTAAHPYESGPFTYYWDFGDYHNPGGWSTVESPTWTYNTAGTYNCHLSVTLTPTNQTVDVYHNIIVTVKPPPWTGSLAGYWPAAGSSDLSVIYSQQIDVLKKSTNLATSWVNGTSLTALYTSVPIYCSADGSVIQLVYGEGGYPLYSTDSGATFANTWHWHYWNGYNYDGGGTPWYYHGLYYMSRDCTSLSGWTTQYAYKYTIESSGDLGADGYECTGFQPGHTDITGLPETLGVYDALWGTIWAGVISNDQSHAFIVCGLGYLQPNGDLDANGGINRLYVPFTPSGLASTPGSQFQLSGSSDAMHIIGQTNDGTIYSPIYNVYVSNNYGNSWTLVSLPGSPTLDGVNVYCSFSGQSMTITTSPGYVYTSIDYGATWTKEVDAGSRYWNGALISDDGHKVYAVYDLYHAFVKHT